MALPSGGSLKSTDLTSEFGGVVPNSLSEYYRNGGYVPDSVNTEDIPTSGKISYSDFLNTSNLLPHPIAIGANLFEKELNYTFSEVCTGFGDERRCIITTTGSVGTKYDSSYTFNPLHMDGTYKVEWSMTASATYGFTYGKIYIDVNGVNKYAGTLGAGSTLPSDANSWFRDNTGKRDRNTTGIVVGFGDVVRARMIVYTRDSNAYQTNHSQFKMIMQRTA